MVHVTITSLSKFLGLIGNHFSYPWCSEGAALPQELRYNVNNR